MSSVVLSQKFMGNDVVFKRLLIRRKAKACLISQKNVCKCLFKYEDRGLSSLRKIIMLFPLGADASLKGRCTKIFYDKHSLIYMDLVEFRI